MIKELRNRYIRWVVPTDAEVTQDAEFGMKLKIINQISKFLINGRIKYELDKWLTGQV